jgi:hypothetical protein
MFLSFLWENATALDCHDPVKGFTKSLILVNISVYGLCYDVYLVVLSCAVPQCLYLAPSAVNHLDALPYQMRAEQCNLLNRYSSFILLSTSHLISIIYYFYLLISLL